MSILLMAEAWKLKLASASRKLVLVKLADNANDTGTCWPSYAYLAAQCEMTERSVIRHINDLVLTGFITKTHRYGGTKFNKTNLFQLTLENGDISKLKELKNAKGIVNKVPENFTNESDFRGDNLSLRENSGVTLITTQGDKQHTLGVTEMTSRGDMGSPRTIIESSIESSIEPSCSKQPKKAVFISDIFNQYPAHRRGGTSSQLRKVFKQEKLTEKDASLILNWLAKAAQSDPQWGTDAKGQFVHGITKFIRERIWLTPIPVVQENNQNQPMNNAPDFHSGNTTWANDLGL